jgi:hypothetical protein
VIIEAEPMAPVKTETYAHLRENRRLIVHRALLASALRSFLPIPGMDELLAGQVCAGLYMKLATLRQVDLPAEVATVLTQKGDLQKSRSVMSTISLFARFAGRKAFALLASGRGAAEMARLFQTATLFDHYCARLHVGGAITHEQAERLRDMIDQSVAEASQARLSDAFHDGASLLGRSLLESPRWLANELSQLAERFVRSGGNADVNPSTGETIRDGEAAWLNRATLTVEAAIRRAGDHLLDPLLQNFEQRLHMDKEH